MFRTRSRGPRRPKVYRIPIEKYLITLAIAFVLSIAFSLLSVPKEIDYRLTHHFGVEEETFLPSRSRALEPVARRRQPDPAARMRRRILSSALSVDATIGSTNFDNRSFRLNDEINLTVYDREVGRRLEEMFVEDLARSRSYTYAQWRIRPLKQRLTEWLILPFRGEL